MNACRAVLLLAALTCSAHAADLVSFSADHVTIKIEIGFVHLDNLAKEARYIALRKEEKMPKVLVLANLFCGAYGKNPHEIITEHEYIEIISGSHTRYDIIHYACTAPKWWGLFEDKE